MPARCTVQGQLVSVSVQQVRALSALVREVPVKEFSVSVQQVRSLSALVREVPVKEFPMQCPWCVPLPVPVVRFFFQ